VAGANRDSTAFGNADHSVSAPACTIHSVKPPQRTSLAQRPLAKAEEKSLDVVSGHRDAQSLGRRFGQRLVSQAVSQDRSTEIERRRPSSPAQAPRSAAKDVASTDSAGIIRKLTSSSHECGEAMQPNSLQDLALLCCSTVATKKPQRELGSSLGRWGSPLGTTTRVSMLY